MIINRYSGNIIVSSAPGVISILLSFFSIPVYLRYLGFEEYGNFLILHILLSIVMITNFNLGKIASIRIQKVSPNEKNSIISTTLFFSFISSAIITLVLLGIYLIISKNNSNFIIYNYKIFFLTLFISNLYVTLENICKGIKHFFISSFSNLIFYSLSLSIPAAFIMMNSDKYTNVNSLFQISVYCKIISIFIIFLILIFKNFINQKIFSKTIIEDFVSYAKWQTLSSAYIQIFDFFDKYLIKIFLGASSLSLYSIPQQIAGKLAVISEGMISVFLPRISSKQKFKVKFNIFNSNLYGFFYFVGLILIIINPFVDQLLIWWLEDSANLKLIYLFKIFLLISFYICITSLISTFIDTESQSKKNFEIESLILIFFILGLIISVYFKNLNYFAFTILVRAIFAFILKAYYIKKYILNFNIFLIKNIIFVMILISSIRDESYFFYFLTFLLILICLIFWPKKLIKKEFFK